jgi:TP53 regulating kinase and related kinases
MQAENVVACATSPGALPIPKRPRIGPPFCDSATTAPIGTAAHPIELARGAEGVLTHVTYLGRSAVRKTRFPKSYRHPELDTKLTGRRLAQEARALLRLRKAGVRVPALYAIEQASAAIVMEFVEGAMVKDYLRKAAKKEADAALRAAGAAVRIMHDAGYVHGDLTTSNMIVAEGPGCNVVLIDFGLSSTSDAEEDKAVDLYVLERAVVSAHPEQAVVLNEVFFDAYFGAGAGREEAVLTAVRLEDVRSRGRKRDMLG